MRANTGTKPNGERGRPQNASRFFTATMLEQAIAAGQSVFAETGNTDPVIQFSTKIGEGYLKGQSDPNRVRRTDQAQIRFTPQGDPITAFPLLIPVSPDKRIK